VIVIGVRDAESRLIVPLDLAMAPGMILFDLNSISIVEAALFIDPGSPEVALVVKVLEISARFFRCLPIMNTEFTAIAIHESVLEFSLLDILDGLISRFMVTVSSEKDNTTKSIHGRFDLIKFQLSDMESIFHGDFVRLHDKILFVGHMDRVDEEVNVAVEGSFIRLEILLLVDLDVSYFLPAA